jgi:hypothetical protein
VELKSMKYTITFRDEIEAGDVEEAYDILLSFLKDSVANDDLTPFEIVRERFSENNHKKQWN